ncbi:hypothetical protein CcCBS67573_g02096 [Chytriomyces confervae]|uniref:5-azacytidine-induced protein 1 n=1 Tax=Chytriomyces confervae TaxID=246404 RepID=A0A507FJM8_9FUNG|nr:hypothetical protein CcCBS67573_g02096 [Chytriomyces confervae]
MTKLTLAEEIRLEAEREMRESCDREAQIAVAAEGDHDIFHFTRSSSKANMIARYDVNASQRIDRILNLLKTTNESAIIPVESVPVDVYKEREPSAPAEIGKDDYKPAIFDEVKAKLVAQQQELDEKSKLVQSMTLELSELKESSAMQADEYKKSLKTRLSAQRKEFEAVVKRHLTFIDTLLAEKNELAKKCETLSEDMKHMERSFKEKMKLQEDQNLKEVKQQRELWQASEKIKRDKWISEKTKVIKDQTVKGLEPEIQRMIAQHKIQLRQSEEKHKEDIIREKRQLMDTSQQQLEQLREKLTTERQKACEEEREYARQRYQKQLERDEMEYQQQKRKLTAEFEQQKHYIEEEARQARTSDQLEHKKAMDQMRDAFEKERFEAKATLESAIRKQAMDQQLLREQLQIEKEQWQDRFMAKQDAEIRAWEKQLKERLIKERDDELEMIVQRLECETSSTSGDIHKRYQTQIEKMKSDMAEEIKQLREKHNLSLDKVIEAQQSLQSIEEQKREMQKQLLHSQHQCISQESLIATQKAELQRLKMGENELSATIRREFSDKLQAQESLIQTLQAETQTLSVKIPLLNQQHQEELKRACEEKELSLSTLETRVAAALASKDEQIKFLRTKVHELSTKNNQLKNYVESKCQELL